MEWLQAFSIAAGIGIIFWLLSFFLKTPFNIVLSAVAWLAILPWVVYANLLTIWHWKARYRGRHSDLWGGLILFETSGCFKIVYLFRHIIPDARSTGRYRLPPEFSSEKQKASPQADLL